MERSTKRKESTLDGDGSTKREKRQTNAYGEFLWGSMLWYHDRTPTMLMYMQHFMLHVKGSTPFTSISLTPEITHTFLEIAAEFDYILPREYTYFTFFN